MATCRNDDPTRRVKGVLDPARADEIAYAEDLCCAGSSTCPPKCPAGYYATRKWSESGGGGYCFGDSALFKATRDKVQCRRSPDSYNSDTASLIRCCTDPSDATQKECRPGYCPASANCDSLMSSSCSAQFLDDAACKSWCMNNPGRCDAGALQYCDRQPGDPFCACIKSPAARPGSGALALPGCFDGRCIAVGYHLQPMLGQDCPQVCQQAVNCWQTSQGTCTIDSNQFQLTCGATLPPAQPAPPTPTPPTPTPPPATLAPSSLPAALFARAREAAKARPLLMLAIALIVLVSLIAIAVASARAVAPLATTGPGAPGGQIGAA